MSETMKRLRDIMATLRSPTGCPWDREQTHESLRALLLEECYEAIDAINRADDANLCEELGDLLLLVVMHAELGAERRAFHFDEVVNAVCEKLIRRHPHVFGDKTAQNSHEVLKQWEQIKRAEKGSDNLSVLNGITKSLPALLRAQAVQKKAARVGFDWPDTKPVFEKLREEISEIRMALEQKEPKARLEEEVGDLLFSAVNLARKLGIDSELALGRSTDKFVVRFQEIERRIAVSGRAVENCSLAELDALWEEVKKVSEIAPSQQTETERR